MSLNFNGDILPGAANEDPGWWGSLPGHGQTRILDDDGACESDRAADLKDDDPRTARFEGFSQRAGP